MYGVKDRGMGVVVNPNGSYYVPSYCSWMPMSSFLDACKPPTKEQFMADQMSSVGGAAKSNPALIASLEQSWQQSLDQSCASNPGACADYQTALKYPNLSAAVGTGAIQSGESVGEFVRTSYESAKDTITQNWGAMLALAAVGLFGVMTLLTPGPRRYGR